MYRGLRAIAKELSLIKKKEYSPEDIAYMIRYLYIGNGCLNQCKHCFADSSPYLTQMNIHTFKTLASEIGLVLKERQKPLDFLYFGASSDPSMIRNYSKYIESWLNYLPTWQLLKVYTHGWNLNKSSQKNEILNLLEILNDKLERLKTFGFSIDLFSVYANNSWDKYVQNIIQNMSLVISRLPLDRLKLQITYPLERYFRSTEESTIAYWKNINGEKLSYEYVESVLEKYLSQGDDCGRLTHAIFQIGKFSNLSIHEILTISRDNGIPFYSGRAKNFYKELPKLQFDKMSTWSRKQQIAHALGILKNNSFGYEGLEVFPDGSVRIIDCRQYQTGMWLKEGLPIVDYIKS